MAPAALRQLPEYHAITEEMTMAQSTPPKQPPLTAHLWETGTPEQLEPYTAPCRHGTQCEHYGGRHLTTRAARQLYDDWWRQDQTKAALKREQAGEADPCAEPLRHSLHRVGRDDLIEPWMP